MRQVGGSEIRIGIALILAHIARGFRPVEPQFGSQKARQEREKATRLAPEMSSTALLVFLADLAPVN